MICEVKDYKRLDSDICIDILEIVSIWLNEEFLGIEDSLHQKSPRWSSKVQFITTSKMKQQFLSKL